MRWRWELIKKAFGRKPRGLHVGYVWAESVINGAQSVLRDADFRSMGFLPPTGSGAEHYKDIFPPDEV